MIPTYDTDNLPSDPATWAEFRKHALTRMVRIDGPFAVDLHADDPDSKQMDATWPVVESHMWCGRFRRSGWRRDSEATVSLVRSVVSRLATQPHRR